MSYHKHITIKPFCKAERIVVALRVFLLVMCFRWHFDRQCHTAYMAQWIKLLEVVTSLGAFFIWTWQIQSRHANVFAAFQARGSKRKKLILLIWTPIFPRGKGYNGFWRPVDEMLTSTHTNISIVTHKAANSDHTTTMAILPSDFADS